MMGRLPRGKPDGKWKYTLSAAAREEAGFQTMEEYIQQQQNTVVQCIATQSLLYLCEELERVPGAQVQMRWWEQSSINLVESREAAAAEASVGNDGGE